MSKVYDLIIKKMEGEEKRFWYRWNHEDNEGSEFISQILMLYPDNRFTLRKDTKSVCVNYSNYSETEVNTDIEGTYSIEGYNIQCVPIKEEISITSSSSMGEKQTEQKEGEKAPFVLQ